MPKMTVKKAKKIVEATKGIMEDTTVVDNLPVFTGEIIGCKHQNQGEGKCFDCNQIIN